MALLDREIAGQSNNHEAPAIVRDKAEIEEQKDSVAAGNRHAVRVHPPPGRLMKVIGISLIVVSLGACPHPAKEVADFPRS